MNRKKIVIIGGGTNTYISNHLALSAPAYGATAKDLLHKFNACTDRKKYVVDLYLTKMAMPKRPFFLSYIPPDTPEEVEALVDTLIADPDVRVIVFNVAMVDYKPERLYTQNESDFELTQQHVTSDFGKYATRLNTRQLPELHLEMTVQDKIIQKIRKERKDIFLVGFKTTCGATQEEQFNKGLKLVKEASCNIVFANDVSKERINLLNNSLGLLEERTQSKDPVRHRRQSLINSAQCTVNSSRNNALITPEESSYWYDTRAEALDSLVNMTLSRIDTNFTRFNVINFSKPNLISIQDSLVSVAFNTVLLSLIDRGAYSKNVVGKTPGHFGFKYKPFKDFTRSYSSIRKQDYTNIQDLRLVQVFHKDIRDKPPEKLLAVGAKPSVGDRTQRELFKTYSEFDCIVHFHKPLRVSSRVVINTISQYGAECGGSTCAINTTKAMVSYSFKGTTILAVHLDHHGPNIMFKKDANPEHILEFIDTHWDLTGSTNGLEEENR